MSAVEKNSPLILVKISLTGSIGQLHLVSSIIEFKYLASSTILRVSPLFRIMTGLMKVLPSVRYFVLTGAIMSKYSRTCRSFSTVSFNWIGTFDARCLRNSSSSFRGRCS